jgi:asparagine synthase (glutamine-hydrolysing)
MCGIAGWFGALSDGNPSHFMDALAHRGPDDCGMWQSKGATLVHTRLAIIDLTPFSHQPMLSHDQEYGLVFNGEIYNYQSLRSHLSTCEPKGKSDTEMLLLLLMEKQEKALRHLAGMYAFAFWDQKRQRGILARDPFGIKPLYYRQHHNGSLSFASETHPLRENNDVLSPDALRDTFLWGTVPSPQTLWMPIRQVPPGCYLTWDNGKVEIVPYVAIEGGLVISGIDPVDDNSPDSKGSDFSPKITDWRSAVQFTRRALIESVTRHLVSDVPVGIFLSGGIDSTAILALTRLILGSEAKIHTFSIGFNETSYNESVISEKTSAHFGSMHTTWKVNSSDWAKQLQEFMRHLDLPTIDGFNTWCVSDLAHQAGMKVVLSGVGGDEFFAGYPSFIRVPLFKALYHSWFRHLTILALRKTAVGSAYHRLLDYLIGDGSWIQAYHAMRGIFTVDEAKRLTKHILGKEPSTAAFSDVAPKSLSASARSIISHFEVTRYLRNQLLRDSDLFSMAHGLELRTPFVDARLSHALSHVPTMMRLKYGKKLLIAAVPEIPHWVLKQPKRGFLFPMQQWIKKEFSRELSKVEEFSPVPLVTWYRTWALACVMKVLGYIKFD